MHRLRSFSLCQLFIIFTGSGINFTVINPPFSILMLKFFRRSFFSWLPRLGWCHHITFFCLVISICVFKKCPAGLKIGENTCKNTLCGVIDQVRLIGLFSFYLSAFENFCIYAFLGAFCTCSIKLFWGEESKRYNIFQKDTRVWSF